MKLQPPFRSRKGCLALTPVHAVWSRARASSERNREHRRQDLQNHSYVNVVKLKDDGVP